jgi:hypothetical protein
MAQQNGSYHTNDSIEKLIITGKGSPLKQNQVDADLPQRTHRNRKSSCSALICDDVATPVALKANAARTATALVEAKRAQIA